VFCVLNCIHRSIQP